jgi:hypothetical protein
MGGRGLGGFCASGFLPMAVMYISVTGPFRALDNLLPGANRSVLHVHIAGCIMVKVAGIPHSPVASFLLSGKLRNEMVVSNFFSL